VRRRATPEANSPEARLDAAFAAAPRRRFLPADQRRYAAQDRALPVGHGSTNSQPSTVRRMLRLLDVAPGHRVLDVGCGTGWTTALLASLVAPDGGVVGVELVPEVLAMVPDRVATTAGVELRLADPDVLGWPEGGPYDRILVSADAAAVHRQLVEQLTPDGVLVGPVRGQMLRLAQGGREVTRHGRYLFVPLRTLDG
jgi:protein-L-isoaspartate(D-aspartate) O-methyltransferase